MAGGPGYPHTGGVPLLGLGEGREATSPVSLIGFGLHGNLGAGGAPEGGGEATEAC